jgi:hypothetical protein
MPFAGWSPIGIAAFAAIVAGIVLLVVYAVQRGLVHHDLEGIEVEPVPGAEPADTPSTRGTAPARRSRTLGTLGATLLVAGLALGLISAASGWGGGDAATGGPGPAPQDCAQSWEGCPRATPAP